MVTRCDTSKVKGLQVGPSAKNAHIAGKEQQQLCLHFSVQKLFSSHNGSSAYNGWMDLLVPGGQGTRTASLFASKALLSPSSILEQRLGNTWDTIRKSGTDVDTPQNVLLLWAVQIIILQKKKKHAKCKTVTCQNAYRHTMFAATPSPIHRNGFWWRSQHPNIASSRTPSCVDYLGRSKRMNWSFESSTQDFEVPFHLIIHCKPAATNAFAFLTFPRLYHFAICNRWQLSSSRAIDN